MTKITRKTLVGLEEIQGGLKDLASAIDYLSERSSQTLASGTAVVFEQSVKDNRNARKRRLHVTFPLSENYEVQKLNPSIARQAAKAKRLKDEALQKEADSQKTSNGASEVRFAVEAGPEKRPSSNERGIPRHS